MDKELAGFGWYIKRIDNALAREACRNVQSHNLTMQQSHLLHRQVVGLDIPTT